MTTKNDILRQHYTSLVRKVATWAGTVALMAMTLVPGMASATGQVTTRSTTLGSDAVSANTTYSIAFHPGTSGNIGSVKFQICDSPLQSTTCANSAGASGASFTTPGASLGSTTGLAGFSQGTSALAPTTNTYYIVNGTPQAVTTSTAIVVPINSVHNPSTTNTSYYVRIYTYSDSAATTLVDYGAMAVSTANQITVSANVQESLTFCVYTGINCAAGGSTVNLGTGTDNVLSSSQASGGVSKMDAATNATTGYIITYIASDLSSSSDTITAAGGSAGTFTPGTAKFGLNLKANTTALTPAGALGANASGGSGVAVSPYATADNVAFVSGATPQTVANSASGPTLNTTYTVTYAAQAGSTTKPGAYSTTFTYVCTGTF